MSLIKMGSLATDMDLDTIRLSRSQDAFLKEMAHSKTSRPFGMAQKIYWAVLDCTTGPSVVTQTLLVKRSVL